eukprot:c25759_g1_i1.p1 GENE.c25759_g1_i1~~c25759_g1_i1.p1  ORF type:complete len:480 (-),score=115.03 c25759_g1_i1:41-1480(-)
MGSCTSQAKAMPAHVSTLAAFAASLGALSMGLALGYTSPALDDIKKDLDISETKGSLFSALLCVGAMIGSFFGGHVGSKYGRRAALICAVVPTAGGWVMIASSGKEAAAEWLLYVGRIFVGWGIGIASFAVPTYIIEVSPPAMRGGFGALNQLQVTIGILVVYALGVPLKWRLLGLVCMIPSGACALAMMVFPESPQWLLAQGRRDEASQALARLRGLGQSEVEAELAVMENDSKSASNQGGPKPGLGSMFEPRYRLCVTIALGCMVVQQFSGVNAAIFFSADIFSEAGQSNSKVSAAIFGAVQVVATAVSCVVMDKAGRRVLLLGSIIGMGISAAVLGLFFYLKDHEHQQHNGWLAMTSVLVYITCFSMGVGPIPWLMMPEVLPTEIRAITGGVATCVNWTGAFIVALTFAPLRGAIQNYGCFWAFSSVCGLGAVFFYFMVPETKGRSLDEIQQLLQQRKRLSEASMRSPLVGSRNDD